MGDKTKRLCKWKKSDYEDLDALRDAVGKAKYACQKCGRVAGTKKQLCKPAAL